MFRGSRIVRFVIVGVSFGLVLPPAVAQSSVVRVGREFPTFSATEAMSGKPLKLEDLRGRIVLIDFWATWCSPCRKTIPEVRKIYETYHDKGLEIVGISVDKNIDACKRFIRREKMNWIHVIEGGGWNTRLVKKYGVRGIPTMVLLDTRGVVVEANLYGQSLSDAIERALQKTPPVLDEGERAEAAAQAELKKADALRSRKKYVAAAEVYEAIRKEYGRTDAAREAAQRLEDMRADKKIAAALEKAAKKKRREAETRETRNWLAMARSLVKAGKYDAARKYYQRILDEYPDSDEALVAKRERAGLPE